MPEPFTLYTVTAGSMNRIKEGSVGKLRVDMDRLRRANKSTAYAIYQGHKLVTRVG